MRSDLKPQDGLPEDTVLWAHLQSLSGGAWNGCVYDFELINKNTLDGDPEQTRTADLLLDRKVTATLILKFSDIQLLPCQGHIIK